MIPKTPIFAQRIRKIPRHFSWLDHRLVHDRHIEQCSHPAAALYLFLVTVSDASGLSYYGDDSIMNRLSMDFTVLEKARDNLIHIGLVAWKKPIYQILPLDTSVKESMPRSTDTDAPMTLKDIFKRIGGHHD